jgi:ABC-type dipeptide/oligopeptide/nickel transport system ATPase component
MNKFSITIENIQHIKELDFSLDINKSGLIAIIGKNGVGKTMLFKGIQNLITSNTFAKTSNKYIYKDNSTIFYTIDDISYNYTYNKAVETLDYNGEIDKSIKENIYVELPIPFGRRFDQFQRLAQVDGEIRSKLDTQDYTTPDELIKILNYIYDTDRFTNLVELKIKREKYYAIPLENSYYIREDYLSSAEYFIISMYKMIQRKCKFIAIDEIDISLDAMAQVRFIEKLRELSQEYSIKILFSTHSLALIKTLKEDELYYMDLADGVCSFERKSYNYIKSLLYGFKDYDKYILTEDIVLTKYMSFLLQDSLTFSKYIILPIAGSGEVVRLMNINEKEKIFETKENVCVVLDGDMREERAYQKNNIYFTPFNYIEDFFLECFSQGDFNSLGNFSEENLKNPKIYNVQRKSTHKHYSKSIYDMFIRKEILTEHEIFKFLSDKKFDEVNLFKEQLVKFLNPLEIEE